jgi:hypothetical protein
MTLGVDNYKVQYNERRHVDPIYTPTHLKEGAGIQLHPHLAPVLNDGCVVEGDKGKKHYTPSYSRVQTWKQSMKISKDRREYGSEVVERGKKFIGAPATGPSQQWPLQRKHNMDQQLRRGHPQPGLSVNFKSLKHFPPRGEPEQYDMETYMNRKQRPGQSIETMRNGIPVAVPGDRAFKQVEHEPGYYAKGGLIPGSSIQLRKSAKPERGSGVVTSGVKNGEKKLSYYEKQKKKEEQDERMQVFVLTNASNKQGTAVPCFEERTGAYLVKPEDEAY